MSTEGPSDELQEVEEELVNKKSENSQANDDEEQHELQAMELGLKAKDKSNTAFLFAGESLKVFTQVREKTLLLSILLP